MNVNKVSCFYAEKQHSVFEWKFKMWFIGWTSLASSFLLEINVVHFMFAIYVVTYLLLCKSNVSSFANLKHFSPPFVC